MAHKDDQQVLLGQGPDLTKNRHGVVVGWRESAVSINLMRLKAYLSEAIGLKLCGKLWGVHLLRCNRFGNIAGKVCDKEREENTSLNHRTRWRGVAICAHPKVLFQTKKHPRTPCKMKRKKVPSFSTIGPERADRQTDDAVERCSAPAGRIHCRAQDVACAQDACVLRVQPPPVNGPFGTRMSNRVFSFEQGDLGSP